MKADSLTSSFKRRCNYNRSAFFLYLLFPVWFASFLAIAGIVWRPPWASAALIVLLLGIIGTLDWAARRWNSPKWSLDVNPNEEGEAIEETVLQQMIRSKTSEGLERLDGTFLAEFLADSMTTTVHIPFCPAFERVPTVQVFAADESDAHLRIASAKPFGIRVDVKRKSLTTDKIRFVVIAEEAPQ